MTTIIFSHPWHGSFNHAVLETVTQKLDEQNTPYQIIDLTADNFNPAMTTDDLRLYSKGDSADPIVQKYRDILLKTDDIIFIFPVWWGMLPANLKGFFDKVLLKGSAFNYDKNGDMLPLLNISRTLLITTSQGETEIYHPFFVGYLIPRVLNAVGMNNVMWLNCEKTSHGPEENRKNFLQQVAEII